MTIQRQSVYRSRRPKWEQLSQVGIPHVPQLVKLHQQHELFDTRLFVVSVKNSFCSLPRMCRKGTNNAPSSSTAVASHSNWMRNVCIGLIRQANEQCQSHDTRPLCFVKHMSNARLFVACARQQQFLLLWTDVPQEKGQLCTNQATLQSIGTVSG
jgi:hypothetical protein